MTTEDAVKKAIEGHYKRLFVHDCGYSFAA